MANPYVFTIVATDRTSVIEAKSLRWTEGVQQRGTGSFDVVFEDASYSPSNGDEFTITKNSTLIMRGLVERVTLGGYRNSTVAATASRVTFTDLSGYFDRRVVNLELDAGLTLDEILDELEPIWGTILGFTKDATQAAGPTYPALKYSDQTLSEVFADLANRSIGSGVSWQLQVDFDKEFRFIEVGTVAAPFSITPGSCQYLDGDLTKEPNAIRKATRIIVRAGESGRRDVSKSFTGDGTEDTYQLDYAIAGPNPGTGTGAVGLGLIRVGSAWETIGAIGSGRDWTFNQSTLEITRTLGNLGNGVVATMRYSVEFPVRVVSEVPGLDEEDYVEKVIPAPDLYNLVEAQAFADRARDAYSIEPVTVRYPTLTAGLRPGMSQNIERPDRAVAADDFTITQLQVSDLGGEALVWQVSAVAGEIVPKPWPEQLKDAAGIGRGSTRPTPGSTFNGGNDTTSGSGSGPAPEDTWIQVNVKNFFGAFPGLRWLYENAENIALGQPPAPSVADQGSGSYGAVSRKYRIQSGTFSGSVLTAQSELGAVTTFTPSGSGASARITKPTFAGSPTHWRVFGDDDGSDYVDISDWIAVGTTTYDDSDDPTAYVGPAAPDGGSTGLLSLKAQMLLTALSDSPNEALLKLCNPGDTGVMSFIPWGTDYQEQYFGAEVVNGVYIARSAIVGLLSHTASGIGNLGLTIYGSQTPGSPVDFGTQVLGVALAFDTSAVPGGSLFLVGNQQSSIVCDALGLNAGGGPGGSNFGVGLYHDNTVALTAARALRFRTGDADRVIRFDGVGTPVTFT